MLFASKGLFAKALYQRGVGFELLVTARALLAVPLFAWVALRVPARTPDASAEPASRPRARAVLAAVVAGFVCYYVGALVDFWALTLIDASIERVLLFSYPALVVLIGSCLQRRAPEARVLAAMVVTYVGIFFAMGGIDSSELRANLFGAALVLVAAFTTAIYFLIGERYTHELGSTRFAAIGMSSAAAMLALHFALFRSFGEIAALGPPTGSCSASSPSHACSSPGCCRPRVYAASVRSAPRSAVPSARRQPSCWPRCSSANGSPPGSSWEAR